MASAGDRVCLGVITSPHGVRGMVKVKPFTEDATSVGAYGPVTLEDGRQFKVDVRSLNKGMVLAALNGITSREDAEALRGEAIYVDRDRLPEPEADSVYQADLIGLIVADPALGEIGRVSAVFDFGAGAMLEVKRRGAKPVLIPFGGAHRFDITEDRIDLTVDPVWLEE